MLDVFHGFLRGRLWEKIPAGKFRTVKCDMHFRKSFKIPPFFFAR